RLKLLESTQYFREGLKGKGFNIKGESQIVPLIIGDNLKTVEFADRLQDKGYWVKAIRPPTVPAGEARLRFSLTFNHQKQTMDKLINALSKRKI
ncbi:MAG TPA: aminotransferase class I/II-fold pyridoxal phosphate-dependent enzyme, partial [Candidatus Omnitrophota bacterium]|nr:aminotransferase class I/II-fold pyridoxal phosphate-dependent enzyme [Candidatus Omnitrophota bacterium]